MKIIAIGASGFIGRHVVRKLAESGHQVAVVHRGNTPVADGQGITEILADRSDLPNMRAQLAQWSPDVVLDIILSSGSQAHALLGAFRGIAGRTVAISSGDVYRAMAVLHRIDPGPLDPAPLTENSPL